MHATPRRYRLQDWQSIGVYSSAAAVGQRGIITRIASGCKPAQEESLRHAMSHLPDNYRIHFAPDTDVVDHNGKFYKYANKPLGMMHWLRNANPPIPPSAVVALIDPDFYFLRPLWHDSFDAPDKVRSPAPQSAPLPPLAPPPLPLSPHTNKRPNRTTVLLDRRRTKYARG